MRSWGRESVRTLTTSAAPPLWCLRRGGTITKTKMILFSLINITRRNISSLVTTVDHRVRPISIMECINRVTQSNLLEIRPSSTITEAGTLFLQRWFNHRCPPRSQKRRKTTRIRCLTRMSWCTWTRPIISSHSSTSLLKAEFTETPQASLWNQISSKRAPRLFRVISRTLVWGSIALYSLKRDRYSRALARGHRIFNILTAAALAKGRSTRWSNMAAWWRRTQLNLKMPKLYKMIKLQLAKGQTGTAAKSLTSTSTIITAMSQLTISRSQTLESSSARNMDLVNMALLK